MSLIYIIVTKAFLKFEPRCQGWKPHDIQIFLIHGNLWEVNHELFSMNVGYASSQGNIRYLDERDFRVAHAYVLSNCDILKPYERYVRLTCLSHY